MIVGIRQLHIQFCQSPVQPHPKAVPLDSDQATWGGRRNFTELTVMKPV